MAERSWRVGGEGTGSTGWKGSRGRETVVLKARERAFRIFLRILDNDFCHEHPLRLLLAE